jgi:hypothetical protein
MHALHDGNPIGRKGVGTASKKDQAILATILPTGPTVTLEYMLYLDVETTRIRDALGVFSFDENNTGARLWCRDEKTPQREWTLMTLDLSASAGQTVEVWWQFETGNETEKSTEGVYVDGIQIHGC